VAAKDVSIIVKAIDQFTAPVQEMSSRMKGFADGISGIFKGMLAGLAAIGIIDFFKDSIKQAAEAEEGWGRLGVAVGNAGGDFKALRPDIEEAIKATQRMSTATDDDLRDALTNLITISGDYKGSIKNLGLTADVAAFKHIGLAEAGEQVGKAMQGSEKVFKNFGIVAGDNASKMEQLRQTVKGFSENEANTFEGTMKRISNAWQEVKRATGEAIITNQAVRDDMGGVVGKLNSLETAIGDNRDSFGSLVTVLGGVGSAFLWIVGILGQALTGAISVVQATVVTFMGAWAGLKAGVQEAVGIILESMGGLAVAGKSVLSKFGIDLGTGTAEAMSAAGKKMVAEAKQTGADTWSVMKESYKEIFVGTEEHQDALARSAQRGGAGRTALTRDALHILGCWSATPATTRSSSPQLRSLSFARWNRTPPRVASS